MHDHLLNVFRIHFTVAGYSSQYFKVDAKSLKDKDVVASSFPTYFDGDANVTEVLPGNVIVKHSYKGNLCTIVNDRNDSYVQHYTNIDGMTIKTVNAFDSIDNFISYFHALLYCGLCIQSSKPVRAMESVVISLEEVTDKMLDDDLNLYSNVVRSIVTTVNNVDKKLNKLWSNKIKDTSSNWVNVIKDNLFHKGSYCNKVACDSDDDDDSDSDSDFEL